MDKSKVKQFVNRVAGRLVRALGLSHWNVRFAYGPPSTCAEAFGECNRQVDYDAALITLNHDKLEDEDSVRTILLHEMFHVVLAPWDVYRNVVCAAHVSGSPEDLQERVIWSNVCERAVINLDRMWEGSRDYWRAEFAREAAAAKKKKGKR